MVKKFPYTYDCLVVGGGQAALASAIAAKEGGASVAIVSKGKIGLSGASVISNAVFTQIFLQDDSPEYLFQDILKSSRYITNDKLARVFSEECSKRVAELKTKYGVSFYQEKQVKTPGHSFPRRVYAGNPLGKDVTTAMRKYAEKLGIDFYEKASLLDLLRNGNKVVGILTEQNNEYVAYYSSSVILATGGFGGLYEYTDNPNDVMGEGIGIAFRHGANLVDMEFVQFYPYRLQKPANIDVYTKIFAKGAFFVNEKGERFMEKYPRKELETRDTLCYEMFKQEKVLLDFSKVDEQVLAKDSPNVYRLAKKGYTGEWVMSPVQHYCMGGIETDEWGKTNLPGLYACGECSGGLHGANRLAGGSMSETLVFGTRAGQAAAKERGNVSTEGYSPLLEEEMDKTDLTIEQQKEIIRKVKSIMWEKVGIERTTKGLENAKEELEQILRPLNEMEGTRALRLGDEVRVAWAASFAGSLRKESRGAHKLQNVKEEKKEWEKKIIINKKEAPFVCP